MRRIRFEEICGEFVRKEGDEERHECLSCGSRDGLSVNYKAQLYHCWGCGLGGTLGRTTTIPRPAMHPEQVGDDLLDYAPVVHETGLSAGNYGADAGKWVRERGYDPTFTLGPFGIFPTERGFGVPFRLGSLVSGYQTYQPHAEPRYFTTGVRGLCPERRAQTTIRVILCEGIFDAFAVDCSYTDPFTWVIFIGGNQISNRQLTRLVLGDYEKVFIAFDNDKPEAALRASRQLQPYAETLLALPPQSMGKDWDEAYQKDKDEVARIWKEYLG